MRFLLQVGLVLFGTFLTFANGRPDLKGDKETDLIWHLLKPRRGDIDLSRPGTCPADVDVTGWSSSACTLQCLFDLECQGSERCCPDDCGGTFCVATDEQKVTSTVATTLKPQAGKTPEYLLPDRTTSVARGNTEPTLKASPTVLANTFSSISTSSTTGKTTESAAQSSNGPTPSPYSSDNDTDIFVGGEQVVNMTVMANSDLVLRCNISTTSKEPLEMMWMMRVERGYQTWSVVVPKDKIKVHKGGAWLEILGVNLEDSNIYVCLGGHSRGYLTKTYIVLVIEDIAEIPEEDACIGGDACQNGGTCVNKSRTPSYKCKCKAGFEGKHCEFAVKKRHCRSDTCLNGGLCIDKGETFQCICEGEFTGERCKEAVTVEATDSKLTTLSPVVQTTPSMPGLCFLPMDPGSCARKQSKWYYDTVTEQCRSFVYTGCQGNENKFRTYDDCQYACPRLSSDPCSHPIVTGRCKAKIPRWAYSTESETCVEFVYGGCGPTGNNFLSKDECMETCIEDGVPNEPCSCNPRGLGSAFCNSDFVIIGTVRRKVSTHGQLTSLVVELMQVYKGGALTLRRSRFFQEPLLIVKNRYQETRQCQNQCFGDIEDGKKYIFTGTLTRQHGTTAAFLTPRSYVKRAVAKRAVKLERMADQPSTCTNNQMVTSELKQLRP
ncbi:uncharacterized protein [Asterias amurensis]|uniref:uncharacterized protein n=1 Tax=Asterias amurensis TaxID=7602 RepID=UPI003AB28396